MKIGVINSGGDVPGINAVIAAAVKAGQKYDDEFIGFIKGWEGLLNPMDYIVLDLDVVRSISHIGGTILRSTNKGRFAGKVGEGKVNDIPIKTLLEAKVNLDKLGIEALIVIGGDGTLTAAMQLAALGVKIIGVPKTIDNDLQCTDRTFGYSTAVDVIVDALGRLHTTAESHERVFVVETMGRYTGWLALEGGLGGGASAIIIPEFPFSYPALYEFLQQRKASGRNYALIVVAEGAMAKNEQRVMQKDEQKKEILLGGIAAEIVDNLTKLSNGELEIRSLVLGHLQRGGSPNPTDTILAQAYGAAAVRNLHAGKNGQMVALQGNTIVTIPIVKATKSLNTVKKDSIAYQTAESLGIFLGE
jgi:6-phosphofructokinase 1